MDLQVANFQRCEHAFTCSITCQFMCLVCIVTSGHPLHVVVPLYMLLQSTRERTVGQYLQFKPGMSGSKCKSRSHVASTTVFSRYCTVNLKIFYVLCLFIFPYYWCEEYYKPTTVQYHISDYVSWVLRITQLYLGTNWTYFRILRMELICMQGTYCSDKGSVLTLD